MKNQSFVAMFFILFTTTGCSKTATIYMRDGSVIEGKILRSDESSIYVAEVEKCPKKIRNMRSTKICFHDEVPVLRQEIRDIDHPGTVSASVGYTFAILGGAFSLALLSKTQDCQGDECFGAGIVMTVFGLPSALVAVVGLITGIGGTVVWSTSHKAAKSPEPSGPTIGPVALTDGEQTYYGLGLVWSW
jgi:hypothetical protein